MDKTKIYLLFTDTNSLLSQGIKRFTKQKYNHCSIAFDLELEHTYSFGRKRTWNPFIGGFVHEDIQSEFFLTSTCAIYSFDVTIEQQTQMMRFIQEMNRKKNLLHYNFLGLFAVLLQVEWHREHHYFCSQFVAAVLKAANLLPLEKPLSFVTPHDLLHALEAELYYEGLLYTYKQVFHPSNTPDTVPLNSKREKTIFHSLLLNEVF